MAVLTNVQQQNGAPPTARTLRNRRRRLARNARARGQMAPNQAPPPRSGNLRVDNGSLAVAKRSAASPLTKYAYVQLGNTEGGRRAAVKVLHPNGEGDDYVTKYPDGFANSSIVMERRDEYNIPKPPALPAGGLWNAIIVEVPQLLCTEIAMVYPSTAALTSENIALAFCQATLHADDAAAVYPNFQQSTIIDATAIWYSILQSSVISDNIGGLQNGIGPIAKSVRRTAYGVTIDLNAPSLADQGRVSAGQWTPDIARSSRQDTEAVPQVWPVYDANPPALVDTEIVQSDSQSVQHEAKLGLYMPIRVCADVNFTPAAEWRHTAWSPADAASESFTKDDDSYDVVLDGWMIGSSVWSGLSDQATLRIKRHECLELVSAPAGIYAPFSDQSLPNDDRAISIIREFSRNEPHAYPASFNELGTMLQKLVSGIGSAVGNLGIPILSKVAGTAGDIARGSLGSTIAGLIDHIL